MKHLKQMMWENNWQNYIQYGTQIPPIPYGRKMPHPQILRILFVMEQLQGKMSVYEAFLKGLEAIAASQTCNETSETRNLLIKAEKQKIKNLKRGIFNEELNDYINALYRGYKKYCDSVNDSTME